MHREGDPNKGMICSLRDGRELIIDPLDKTGLWGAAKFFHSSYRRELLAYHAHYKKGIVGIVDVRNEHIINEFPVAEIGYFVRASFRGTGLSYLLVYSALVAAEAVGKKTILARIDERNERSIRFISRIRGKTTPPDGLRSANSPRLLRFYAPVRTLISGCESEIKRRGIRININNISAFK